MAATTTIAGLGAVTFANLSDAAVLPCDDALGSTLKATMAQVRTRVLTLPAGTTSPTLNLTGSTTIASTASLTIAGMNYGFVKLVSANTNSFALVMVNSGFGSVIVTQQGTLYTTTAATAAKVNVYVSGANTVIENLSGLSDNFFVVVERLA